MAHTIITQTEYPTSDIIYTHNIIADVIYLLSLGVLAATFVGLIFYIIFKRKELAKHLSTFGKYRHLLFLMVKRDFVTRYRRSILGILWSLLNPLLTMLVLSMVFSYVFRLEIPNLPVYILSGQIIFALFSESTSAAMYSIVGNASIIRKIYVPKYVFPISRIIYSIINFGFAFVAFLIVVLITGAPFHITLLLAPLPLLYLIIFSIGIGLLLSSLVVFFRDLTYLYGIITTLLMFMTPLFYPVEILTPEIYQLIHLNPMFHYVTFFRELALHGTIPGLWLNAVCLGFALASLLLGMWAIMTQQNKYILYL